MGEIAGTVAQLTAVIDKAGTLGVLVLVCVVLGWYVLKLRKELAGVFAQRDKALLSVVKLKTVCELKGIVVDLRDIEDMLPKSAAT